MLNKCMVIGRLGREVEMRYTPNGKAVSNFSVATDSGFGDNKKTEWFNVVAWEKTAEACAQYLTTGSLVYVEGRMQTRSWDDKEGAKKYRTELIAERVQFIDPRGARPESGGSYGEEGYDATHSSDVTQDQLPF